MLSVLLYCLLSATPVTPGAISQRPSSGESAQVAVRRLEAAFKKNDSREVLDALARSGRIADQGVVDSASKALVDPSPAVRLAAVDALRFNSHPAALHALHDELSLPHRGPDADEFTAALIRGVCQKGQVGSLPAMQAKGIDRSPRVVATAWILGMGRLRSYESLETLMAHLGSLPESSRTAHMDEFRLSLMSLSGVDHGMDSAAWMRWWRDKGIEVEIEPEPRLEGLNQLELCEYWKVALDEPHPAQFDVGDVAVARAAAAPRSSAQKARNPNKRKTQTTDAKRANPNKAKDSGENENSKRKNPKKQAADTEGALDPKSPEAKRARRAAKEAKEKAASDGGDESADEESATSKAAGKQGGQGLDGEAPNKKASNKKAPNKKAKGKKPQDSKNKADASSGDEAPTAKQGGGKGAKKAKAGPTAQG